MSTYADSDDDEIVPLRRFITEVGRLCKVELMLGQMLQLDEECTVGELRARMRSARGRLASGALQP